MANITINSVQQVTEAARLSYTEIVTLAGLDPATHPACTYTVGSDSGTLLEDGYIVVWDGMTFNVV